MRRLLLILLLCGFSAALVRADPAAGSPSPPQPPAPLGPPPPAALLRHLAQTPANPDRIEKAIGRGVNYLLQCQNADGGWGQINVADERMAGQLQQFRQSHVLSGPDPDGGRTALITLALLTAGQSHQSPPIKKALDYLQTVKMHTTYAVSLRACVFSMLPDARRNPQLQEDLRWLLRSVINHGQWAGLYSYFDREDSNRIPQGWADIGDLSNSQYGVLGVWYAADAGLEVPHGYWHRAQVVWRKSQLPDGGWAYFPPVKEAGFRAHTPYASMTAAGLATLFITQDFLHAPQEYRLDASAVNPNKKAIDAGLAWLGDHFAVDRNVGRDPDPNDAGAPQSDAWANFGAGQFVSKGTYVPYMLFGFERVGEASGLTRFGKHNWFNEGANFLLSTQNADGSWIGSLGPGEGTAFSLLFLARGRSPVALQKLQYPGRWDNRGRDAAGIVRWLRHQTERHLNWQIVSIDEDLHALDDSPILYITGDRPVSFTPEQGEKIKSYIQRGGLVLCVNEGSADQFARSMASFFADLFPQYHFTDLPPDHPIFTENYPIKKVPYPVRGLSNGVRDLVILLPTGDLSWQWQSMADAPGNPLHAFPLFGNLYIYATGRTNPQFKGQSAWVERNPAASTPSRSIPIARIQYAGNWNPEPAGWTRLSNILANSSGIELSPQPLPLASQIPDQHFKLAHMTATGSFKLTPAEQNHLKQYLDGGGVILFDVAGGSSGPALDFEALMNTLYPGAQFKPLPLDHPIYTGRGTGGREIKSVQYRRFGESKMTSPSQPHLMAMQIHGRIIAICSPQDLSAALVGYPTDGIAGYTPSTAVNLMYNLLLWAAPKEPRTQ